MVANSTVTEDLSNLERFSSLWRCQLVRRSSSCRIDELLDTKVRQLAPIAGALSTAKGRKPSSARSTTIIRFVLMQL
jgi:hypothetical protein